MVGIEHISAFVQEQAAVGSVDPVGIGAELAARCGLPHEHGTRAVPLRSLSFLLPFLLPRLQPAACWTPDQQILCWWMLLTALGTPRLWSALLLPGCEDSPACGSTAAASRPEWRVRRSREPS